MPREILVVMLCGHAGESDLFLAKVAWGNPSFFLECAAEGLEGSEAGLVSYLRYRQLRIRE